jgi:hypothetical protein
MSTRGYCPRANNEGRIGTPTKQWAEVNAKKVNIDGVDIKKAVTEGAYAPIPNMVHSAALHNGLFRGKDLTAYFASGAMSAAIAAGTFDNIYIGDYITKAITVDGTTYNVKWEVADLDYFLHDGDTETTAHHVVMFPSVTIQTNVSMNDTNTTAGGYLGSKMWTDVIPKYAAAIKAAFGADHVLSHRELLTNAVNATAASAAGANYVGTSTNWTWADVDANIPSEPMIYGGAVFGSSAYDVGNKTKQLSIFRFKKFNEGRKWFWLQAVVSATDFADAVYYGYATGTLASTSNEGGGVRPYFLLR